MTIGGFTIMDSGFGLSVTEYEAGWSFWLQGDDAQQFRDEWEQWKEHRDNNFRQFLSEHDYDTLFQQKHIDVHEPDLGEWWSR